MTNNGKNVEHAATAATAEIVPSRGNPSAGELVTLERMGELLHRSGFATGARTREQAVAIVLMGREMGIPAMQALSTIHVIDGKPTAGVHVIGALLARGGVRWRVTEHTERACTIVFERPGWQAVTARFTTEDAQRAGIGAKDNWRRYPRNMCYARAFTEGARMIAPDLCCGLMYTPEEIAPDLAVDPDTGAVVAPEARVDGSDTQIESAPPTPQAARTISEKQRKRAWALAKGREADVGASAETILRAALAAHGIESSKAITGAIYESVCDAIAKYEPPRVTERKPGEPAGGAA